LPCCRAPSCKPFMLSHDVTLTGCAPVHVVAEAIGARRQRSRVTAAAPCAPRLALFTCSPCSRGRPWSGSPGPCVHAGCPAPPCAMTGGAGGGVDRKHGALRGPSGRTRHRRSSTPVVGLGQVAAEELGVALSGVVHACLHRACEVRAPSQGNSSARCAPRITRDPLGNRQRRAFVGQQAPHSFFFQTSTANGRACANPRPLETLVATR
jgi:hypothetical protein